jgi:hypothetical protein
MAILDTVETKRRDNEGIDFHMIKVSLFFF